MEMKDAIQEIRQHISEAEMDAALDKTRHLLETSGNKRFLVSLDLVESEFNHIRDQHLNGLLSTDDQVRFYNINRAKLLELVLQLSGEGDLADNLSRKPGAAEAIQARSAQNMRFKNGLKTVVGILFFTGAIGMVMNKEPLGPCLLTGLCGIVTFPPSLRFIEKLLRYDLLSWQKYTIVIGSILLSGALLPKKDVQQPVDSLKEMQVDGNKK
jgi:hypothetical protein